MNTCLHQKLIRSSMQKHGSLPYHGKAGGPRPVPHRRGGLAYRTRASDSGGSIEASSIVEIPTRLNTIPHERSTRYFFYNDICQSTQKCLDAGNTLLSVRCTIPELNQNFDVYRVGTLLECVREMATMLCKQHGRKVKVCVQQSLGTGVFQGTPLALSGVRRILQQMDWGEVSEQIEIGQLGGDQIDDCQTYILISPQNITGHSVLPLISEMVDEAQADGKEIIMMNPQLGDIMSSGGVMSVRGRQERMDFISTFTTAYHFRLLYIGMGPYPIMGALRYSYGGDWNIYKRVDFKAEDGSPQELYDMIQACEQEPDSSIITAAFKRSKA